MDAVAKVKGWIKKHEDSGTTITKAMVEKAFSSPEERIIAFAEIEELDCLEEAHELAEEMDLSERIDKYSHDERWFKVFLEKGTDEDILVIKEILARKKQDLIDYVKDLAAEQREDSDNIYPQVIEYNLFEGNRILVECRGVSLVNEGNDKEDDTLVQIEGLMHELSDVFTFKDDLAKRVYKTFSLHEDFEFSENNRQEFLESLRQAFTLIEDANLPMYSKKDLPIKIIMKDSGQTAEASVGSILNFFNVHQVGEFKTNKLLKNIGKGVKELLIDEAPDLAEEFMKLVPGIGIAIKTGKISYKVFSFVKEALSDVQIERKLKDEKQMFEDYQKEMSKYNFKAFYMKRVSKIIDELVLSRPEFTREMFEGSEENFYEKFIQDYRTKSQNISSEIEMFIKPLQAKSDYDTACFLVISYIEQQGRQSLQRLNLNGTF